MRGPALLLLACSLAWAPTRGAQAGEREQAERYPASFRLEVEEAIQLGVERLKALQRTSGLYGNESDAEALGHAALPVLALLKAGVKPGDPVIRSAFRAMEKLPMERTYSVACYLMAIHALYQPKLDTFDTDVGSMRAKRVKPDEVKEKLSEAHLEAMERGVSFLVESQRPNGLWHYTMPKAKEMSYDLSNTQYALLGLRAAADCGIDVKTAVWRDALEALVGIQDAEGDEVRLLEREVKDGYVIETPEKAEARPFRYQDGKKDGPMGEKTVPTRPATGSMTCAGAACVAICAEGLWRSRRFSGRLRRKTRHAIRDARAWMQENFSVDTNPGHPSGAHHLYYLYGLERMGMLVDARYVGRHDWYKEGADKLLSMKKPDAWGGHVPTAFAVLFLKRATAPTVAVTGD